MEWDLVLFLHLFRLHLSSYIAVPSSLDQGQGMICMIGSAKSWSCASKNSIMEFLLVQHKATLSKGKGGSHDDAPFFSEMYHAMNHILWVYVKQNTKLELGG